MTSTLHAAGDLAVTEDRLLTRITGRAVPYGVAVDVGRFVETIAPGAFAESLRVTPGLPLHLLHTDAVAQPGVTPLPVGVSVKWDDRRDGLYGTWRLDRSSEAQEAGRLVRDGMLRGLSLRFQPDINGSVWTVRNGREHVTRTRARLVSVSLVSTPAYPTSVVSDIRSAGQAAQQAATEVVAHDTVAALAIDLGTPLINAAITGSPADMRLSANLVWTAIATHGATAAVTALHAIAEHMRRTRPGVAVNLARAAQLIAREDVAAWLRDEHQQQWRALLPAGPDTPRRPTRRRRRSR